MKVSVIIPVYNAAKYVEQAVRSAVAQGETAEVLLVEDCSQDDSLEVCEWLAQEHTNVTVLRHPDGENRGAGASRNLGIRSARYDYIAFLDADDYFLPGRFALTEEKFAGRPEIDGVYEAVKVVFEDQTDEDRWLSTGGEPLITMHGRLDCDQLFDALVTGGDGALHLDGLTVKKSLFDKTGLFDKDLLIGQDTVLRIKMAAVGDLVPGKLDEPVSCYRVHATNRWIRTSQKNLYWRKAGISKLEEWAQEIGVSREKRSLFLLMHLMTDLGPYHDASVPMKALVACRSFVNHVSARPSALISSIFWSNLFRVVRKSFGSSSHLTGGS